MALLPEIEKRRALRAYSEEPIDKEVLSDLPKPSRTLK